MRKLIKNKGVTLISLVITIIVLIILASVGIYLSLENNGIFTKAQEAKEKTQRETATEKINLKITTAQMNSYAEKQEMPTLKELSLILKEDSEISYVTEESKVASAEYNVPSDNPSTIYTKLKDYNYEFGINSSLQLASIDGVKVATNETVTISKEEYDKLVNSSTYSTEEKIIGKWTNGKPLYRKVYNLTTPSTDKSTTIQDVTDLNIDTAVSIDGHIDFLNTGNSPLNIFFYTNDYVSTWLNKTNITMICTNSARQNKPCYITIQYTKTTDNVN